MRVKIFSELLNDDPQHMEIVVNEFLATLTTGSIRHVQTAAAAATENEKVAGRIVITIWYDDLGELKAANDVTEAEIIEISDHQAVSERSA
jgi:cell division protein FtsB